ncbi:MAG: hypothetical protein ACI8UO_004150 [Verrucomicrobiales bacterium]|jgi:hypothetical protein
MKKLIIEKGHYLILGGVAVAALIFSVVLGSAVVGQGNVSDYLESSEMVFGHPPESTTSGISAARSLIMEKAHQQLLGAEKLFIAPLMISAPWAKSPRPPVSDSPLHRPFTDRWALQAGWHEFLKGDFRSRDSDLDGFTNEEEWVGGQTDPGSPDSHPEFVTKLRYLERIERGRRIKFTVTTPGEFFIRHELEGAEVETNFLKIGDRFGGVRFRLAEIGEKDGIPVLTIEDTQTNQELLLIHKEKASFSDISARFRFEMDPDNNTFIVREGAEFSLTPEPTRRFHLIKVEGSKAELDSDRNEKGENKIAIPRSET